MTCSKASKNVAWQTPFICVLGMFPRVWIEKPRLPFCLIVTVLFPFLSLEMLNCVFIFLRGSCFVFCVASILLPFSDWLNCVVNGHHKSIGKLEFGLFVGKLANFGGLFGDVLLKDEFILDEVGDVSGCGNVLQGLHGLVFCVLW